MIHKYRLAFATTTLTVKESDNAELLEFKSRSVARRCRPSPSNISLLTVQGFAWMISMPQPKKFQDQFIDFAIEGGAQRNSDSPRGYYWCDSISFVK